MGTITLPNNPGTIQNTQVTDAAKVMENFAAIVAEVNGNIEPVNIKALAVETAKIAALAVTAAKLATDAVETLKIKDANVTTAKIANLNVTAGKLAADAVETVKIKNLNVTTGKIAADAIDGTKIGDDVLDSEHYVAGSIDTEHIANAQITAGKLATDAVETVKIKNLNVTAGKLAADAVETAKIKDNNVTLAKLALTAFIETLLDDTDAATARTTLGSVGLTGNETIAGNKTFSGQIIDTNGNEVVAMQMETKGNAAGASLAPNTEVDVDVTGFSWNPTAILVCRINYGVSATALYGVSQFGGGASGSSFTTEAPVDTITIINVTCGTAKVTVRLRNNHPTVTYYYDNIIVTAVRAP